MAEVIRAIHEQGHLRSLDPVRVSDGQAIRLAILSEREQVRMALADILMPVGTEPLDDFDETAMAALLDAELQGKISVSDVILEQRREGP